MAIPEETYCRLTLHEWAWVGTILLCVGTGSWYFIYCLKMTRPHRKITLFARSIDKPLDFELARLILLRTLTVALATFSFSMSLIYALTEHWLIESLNFGIRISMLVGAIYLVFLSIQSSTTAIHNHFKDQTKVTPTSAPAQEREDDKPNQDSPAPL